MIKDLIIWVTKAENYLFLFNATLVLDCIIGYLKSRFYGYRVVSSKAYLKSLIIIILNLCLYMYLKYYYNLNNGVIAL